VPIEQVVDTHRHCLHVTIEGTESAAINRRSKSTDRKASVV